ncbi:MAG: copper resistance protein [Rhizobiales bacterium]|nr:copper resistance protein [Hyphomicrobiales bacterium]MBA69544.1 copper resistance protein [Hyphomicrobiales bacterium]
MNPRRTTVLSLLPLAALAGCVPGGDLPMQTALYEDRTAGFRTVSEKTAEATGRQTVWLRNAEATRHASRQVHAMIHRKTISADTAVQVALLNNRGLQAAYADIGIDAADVWQQILPENPVVSVGILGIAAPEVVLFRALEAMIATNLQAMTTRERRVDIAKTRFEQTQLKAVNETLRLAADTRRAWIRAVSAFEAVAYLQQGQVAADAASELAAELGRSGALAKAGQAREHAFYAELTGQLAEARLNAALAKEELTRLMGLWGSEVSYFVPDRLPQLPKALKSGRSIEAEALRKRVDLQIARLELELAAKSYGLTEATRYVTDLELVTGFEAEQEVETEYEIVAGDLEGDKSRKVVVSPQIEFEFAIPIYDTGKPRLRKAELTYLKGANLLAEKAVNIRSEARSAYINYKARHEIGRHYRRSVLPLRQKIEEESLLTYNGMITNTFELLADTRAKINTLVMSVDAKREFWLAEADLNAAIYGPGFNGGGGGDSAPAVADAGGGH